MCSAERETGHNDYRLQLLRAGCLQVDRPWMPAKVPASNLQPLRRPSSPLALSPDPIPLVLRRLLGAIDDEDIHGSALRFELEPELFLQRRED